ncbi:hypothetical protein LUZ61_016442 [Rhynchospora tenuis]|uniref:Uncharacterized protein n=1 Tax=Rhynchospora tenuis TaxID=198213 RepID=A0AAD5Z5K1_9POAL|nr:hypothetical protein LUZ61_016442 [Rhynchospora tenuis]
MTSSLTTQAAMDVSEVCVETLPPEFSKWADDIDATANEVNIRGEEAAWKKPSIYRITSFARSHNKEAFTPQVISFGPFHYDEERLKANEIHKRRALVHFLHRAEKPLKPFVRKLRCILERLQDSYQGLDQKWKDNPHEFLKIMLLDGCFMIEVLRLKEDGSRDYAPNDPVFSLEMMPLRMPYIKRDMLLLENQLPLLVLKGLLEVENRGQTGDQYINKLVLKFCGEHLKATLPGLASHPLELYRMSMLHSDYEEKIVECVPSTICETKVIESAVELRESGVRFRRSHSTSLRDIKFNPDTGWLELPVIPVHDGTEHLLLNMLAFEQIHVGIGNEITAYIMFMDALIDTGDDVKLLQKKKIICNSLGSHKAVADLFNSLAKEAAHNPKDVLNIVRSQLSEYYEKRTNKWRANLRHQYLHNPWKVLSIVVAFLVILFTFLQTLYSALSFHLGK